MDKKEFKEMRRLIERTNDPHELVKFNIDRIGKISDSVENSILDAFKKTKSDIEFHVILELLKRYYDMNIERNKKIGGDYETRLLSLLAIKIINKNFDKKENFKNE